MNNPVMHTDPSGEDVYGVSYTAEVGLGWYGRIGLHLVKDDHGNCAVVAIVDLGGGFGIDVGSSWFHFEDMDNIWQLKETGVQWDMTLGWLDFNWTAIDGNTTTDFRIREKGTIAYSATTTISVIFLYTWKEE